MTSSPKIIIITIKYRHTLVLIHVLQDKTVKYKIKWYDVMCTNPAQAIRNISVHFTKEYTWSNITWYCNSDRFSAWPASSFIVHYYINKQGKHCNTYRVWLKHFHISNMLQHTFTRSTNKGWRIPAHMASCLFIILWQITSQSSILSSCNHTVCMYMVKNILK